MQKTKSILLEYVCVYKYAAFEVLFPGGKTPWIF